MPDIESAGILSLMWDALGDTTLIILIIAAIISIVFGATLGVDKQVDWIEGTLTYQFILE